MKVTLLIAAIFSVIAQFYHTDYVVQLGSHLNSKTKLKWLRGLTLRQIQSYAFSGIIAAAIIFTVLLKMHWVALFWTFIEIFIGLIYQFHNIKFKKEHGNYNDPGKWEIVAGIFMAILMPFCIYAFSFMYAEFELIMKIFND